MLSTKTNARLIARANLAILLGTTSLIALGGPAFSAEQPAAPPAEEILVTGSLIAGAPAVGVPVTSFGQDDFK